VVSGDVSKVSVSATAEYETAAAGTGKKITVSYSLSGGAAGNYTAPAATVLNDGAITAKGLTIGGASAASRAYNGGTIVVVSGGSLVGVVSADGASVSLGGSPAGTVASADAGNGKAVTVTGYTISGSAASNYSLAQPTDVTVDIAKATQTITFNLSPSTVLSSAGPISLSASASSGLTVSLNSSSSSVATVAGSTLTVAGPGTVTITAEQAGNGNYEAATPVSQVLTVLDADLPIAGADAKTAAPIAGEAVKYAMAELLSNDLPSANDEDKRSLSITAVPATSAQGGTVSRKGVWVIYTPNSDAVGSGTDSFTYTLSNGVKTATGTVTVNLGSMPDFTLRIEIESMEDRADGGKTVTFAVAPSKRFEVEATSNLNGSWSSLGTMTSGPDGRLVVEDPQAGSSRFYRVRWMPIP
jgi:hypothetical protein